ncbi:MAG TPA: CBS domain-containing protein [Acidimicrobiales bacterium]|nr:CBS domain-containing protein [Acidimicrobiales bacterium]
MGAERTIDEVAELARIVKDLAGVVARLSEDEEPVARAEDRQEAEQLAQQARRIAHLEVTPQDAAVMLVHGPPVEVPPDLPLRTVAEILRKEVVSAVLVQEGSVPMGIVSERDVVWALAEGGDLTTLRAGDVMSSHLLDAQAEEPIATVAARMLDHGIRHLPVVDEGRVVGIVSARDVLRLLAEALVPA